MQCFSAARFVCARSVVFCQNLKLKGWQLIRWTGFSQNLKIKENNNYYSTWLSWLKLVAIAFVVVSAEWASLKSQSLKEFFIWNRILISRVIKPANTEYQSLNSHFWCPIQFPLKLWEEVVKLWTILCDHVHNNLIANYRLYRALILQGEIWCWSVLQLKGLSLYSTSLGQFSSSHLNRRSRERLFTVFL